MVAGVVDLGHDDLADLAVLDVALGRLVGIVGHALHADLHLDVALLDAVADPLRLFDVVGHRFLAVDVLAGVHGVEGHLGVPMLGDGDHDVVDIGVFEQPAVVVVRFSAGQFRRGVEALLVDVADGDDFGVFRLLDLDQTLHVASGVAARADHADVQAVVGADHARGPRRRDGPRRSSQGATGHGSGYERTSGEIVAVVFHGKPFRLRGGRGNGHGMQRRCMPRLLFLVGYPDGRSPCQFSVLLLHP